MFRFFIPHLLLALAFAASAAASGEPESPRIPRWEPHDFVFELDELPRQDPFTLPFTATIVGPNRDILRVTGFYDGDRTWKIRFSPTLEGEWTLTTSSPISGLQKQTRSFTCIPNPNPAIKGPIKVDTVHPHHFIHSDRERTRRFPMGYRCAWLPALDMGNPDLPILGPFLDKLTEHGFNFVLFDVYARDTPWRRGTTGDDDFGPPAMLPWDGEHAWPDHATLKLAYWQHLDHVIHALYERGMGAHLFLKASDKNVKWPEPRSREDDLYFQTIVTRYAAYPNIHWTFGPEADPQADLGYKLDRIRLITRLDPYRRPFSIHDDQPQLAGDAFEDYIDYYADQHQEDLHAAVLELRKTHALPIVNVAFGCEHGLDGPDDKTSEEAQSPEEIARRAWDLHMAGGYGVYHYTFTAWDIMRPDDTPPGYAYLKILREFFDATQYWLLEPSDELVDQGYCLARPGEEYLVYQPEPRPFSITVEGARAPLPARWFDPLTGKTWPENMFIDGTSTLAPPEELATAGGPVVLHIGAPTGPAE